MVITGVVSFYTDFLENLYELLGGTAHGCFFLVLVIHFSTVVMDCNSYCKSAINIVIGLVLSKDGAILYSNWLRFCFGHQPLVTFPRQIR